VEGKIIDNVYEIGQLLGQGGMGVVHKIRDLRTNKVAVIKFPHQQFLENKEFMQRFLNEVNIGRSLNHKNIILVLDGGEFEGRPYMVMEYLEGEALSKRIEQRGTFYEEEVIRIISPVCEALEYAHRSKVVHRDIKPQNIFITRDGTIKVMDFGIAKALTLTGLTATGTSLGTPFYMAPEQIENPKDIDGRADIYSLGVLLYQLLTGALPFKGDTPYKVFEKHMKEIPASPTIKNPNISKVMGAIIMKALEKDRDKRHQSPLELQQDLLNPGRVTYAYKPAPQAEMAKTIYTPSQPAPTIPQQPAQPSYQPPYQMPTQKTSLIPILAGIGGAVIVAIVILAIVFGLKQEVSIRGPGEKLPASDRIARIYDLSVRASSIGRDGSYRYLAEFVIDGNLSTAWSEGISGNYGIGEWLMFEFPKEYILAKISIKNGYDKVNSRGMDLYYANSRVKQARLEFSNRSSQKVVLDDTRDWQERTLSKPKSRFLRFVIESVYPGTKYSATQITEVKIWKLEEEPSVIPKSEPPEAEESTGDWFVILGSFSKAKRWEAEERIEVVQKAGFKNAYIIDTNNYPNLRDGLWAVVMGPYNKNYAQQIKNKTRLTVSDAYIKSGW